MAHDLVAAAGGLTQALNPKGLNINSYILYLQVRCVVLLCCGERPPPEHETEPSPTQQAAAPAGEPASKVQVPHSEPLIPADAAEERV